MMELATYTLEPLGPMGSLSCLAAGPAPHRRDTPVSARGDPGRGTARPGQPQEAGARTCLAGGARARLGRAAARPRPAPGAGHARARGPRRRAARRPARRAAGARAVLAGRRRPSGRPRTAAQPGPDPQGPQAGPRPGQLSDRPGLAHGLWHRLAAAARAPGARAPETIAGTLAYMAPNRPGA